MLDALRLPTQSSTSPFKQVPHLCVSILKKHHYPVRSTDPHTCTCISSSGQLVEFIRENPIDEDWWEAKNENGDTGYVPSTYVIVKKEHVRIYSYYAHFRWNCEREGVCCVCMYVYVCVSVWCVCVCVCVYVHMHECTCKCECVMCVCVEGAMKK